VAGLLTVKELTNMAQVDVQVDRIELGPWSTNAYIVVCRETKNSVLVDAPADAEEILARLEGTTPRYILLIHNHMDHLGALSEVRSRLKVPLGTHAADARKLLPPPERLLSDGDLLPLGNVNLEVLHTPGHTPGSLCFRVGHYLLSGDTLFPGGPGKTATPGDFKQIVEAITSKIFTLPDDTEVYPGHGSPTVLKKEKAEFARFAARPLDPNLCGDVLWLSA
jgi:glyoxylase-like metal-dependent hydrolase (beta-lactamase superfamily II)